MKKRIVALLLAISVLCSVAFAHTPMEQIQYISPNTIGLEALAKRAAREVKKDDNLQALLTIYAETQEEFERIATMQVLATLRQMQDATNVAYAQEYTRATIVYTEAYEMVRSIFVTLVDSVYEPQFRSIWGDDTVDMLLNSDEVDTEQQAIYAQISKKNEEYRALSLAPVAVIDGKKQYMSETQDFTLRKRIYDQWTFDLGQIYIDLVMLYKQIDEDYFLEAYRSYGRNYTPVDATVFEETVAQSIATVYGKLRNTMALDASDVEIEGTMAEIMDTAAQGFFKIDESLVKSYKILKENQLYDVENRPEKSSGALTTIFPSYGSAFLYIQPESGMDGLRAFYHEFGHYNQMRQEDMHIYWPGKSQDLDAAEVTSQALSLIVSDQVRELFGEAQGDYFEAEALIKGLFVIPSACVVDAFEQFVFSTENLTYEALNAKFAELCETYHIPWNATTWTQIPHIYRSPGYYISYAVSAVSALEVWMKYEENEEIGIATYLAAVDACDDGYLRLLEKANLRNPFYSSDLISEISDMIEKTFGIMVDTYGHWAEAGIDRFTRAGVVTGYPSKDGTMYFRPEQSVTRAEFVKLLYGICTDEKIRPVSESKFSDVPANAWYAPYVAWGVEEGLISGVSETEFAPNQTISRQDMAVLLNRYLVWSKKSVRNGESVSFADQAQISGYARNAVEALRRAKILNGMPNGTFLPKGTVTRAAAVTALCNAYDYIGETPSMQMSAETAQPMTYSVVSSPVLYGLNWTVS